MHNKLTILAASIATLILLSACGSKNDDPQITVPKSSDEYTGKNYEVVLGELDTAGFTNIETEVLDDLILGFITKDGEVESVSIDGNTTFSKGTRFMPDAAVIITYHTFPNNSNKDDLQNADDGNSTSTNVNQGENSSNSVSYSTNDKVTVKNGNSGVYAYKSTGGTYDIYWVIDFDEQCVYWFTDGNGDSTCDRIPMVSGNLNDVLIITYHDGNNEWSNGLHFKWKNQPDTLIMQDNDGFEYEYYTTGLEDALALKTSRTIIDF